MIHPGRCPSKIKRSAAIFIPIYALGVFRAKAKRLSRVASGCDKVKVGFFMN
jgi:hypothetical protein